MTLRVAGKAAEVVASPLVGRHRGQHAAPIQIGRFVGREAELSALRDLAVECLQGTGQVAMVTGAGGVGKSRLLTEVGQWLGEQGLRISRASAQSYGARTSYGVWTELCRQAWEIDADDPPETVIARLSELLRATDPDKLPRLPLLGTLFGVPIPDTSLTASFDARLRKISLESLVVVFEASTVNGPVALLIDAAEHLDALSWDLVEAIGRAVPRMPALLLLARRPADVAAGDAGEAVPDLPLDSLPHVHRMVLAELDDRTSRELALDQVAAANAPSLSQPALDRLISLSGGNPFHLEELVTFLLERGTDPSLALHSGMDLPTSLRSLQAWPASTRFPSRRGEPSRSPALSAPGSRPRSWPVPTLSSAASMRSPISSRPWTEPR